MSKYQDEPLLRSSRASDHSDERIEEEDELLTGKHKLQPINKRGRPFWVQVGLFTWATIATILFIVLAVLYQHQLSSASKASDGWADSPKPKGKRNLVFMVSDGMGPTSLSLARSFEQVSKALPFDHQLVLDEHLVGSSRTRSTSSLITDSAAGATAFACGRKSYNNAISVLPDHSACGTVLEAAKKAGYTTGLVVTTRITDATPACFASHVHKRSDEDIIAEQLIGEGHPLGRVVDLILGGGQCHFQPNTTEASCRKDDVDVISIAKESGWNYKDSRSDFDSLGSELNLPLLGLFAQKDIPYELDRSSESDEYPSLSEMASKALRGLSAATKDKDQGFFLMIEGSRIDHAGHGNDPIAQVHEVLEYDKTFAEVVDFLEKDAVDGILVGTSDHETGGLTAARQLNTVYPEYAWYPDALMNATHSTFYLSEKLKEHKHMHPSVGQSPMENFIRSQILEPGLGIKDAAGWEMDKILASLPPKNENGGHTDYVFADMISRRAQIGWTTHGHSAVDVNVYASSPGAARALVGNHENTEIGQFMRDYLEVDLDAVTGELAAKGEAMGKWKGEDVDDSTKLGLNVYHDQY